MENPVTCIAVNGSSAHEPAGGGLGAGRMPEAVSRDVICSDLALERL